MHHLPSLEGMIPSQFLPPLKSKLDLALLTAHLTLDFILVVSKDKEANNTLRESARGWFSPLHMLFWSAYSPSRTSSPDSNHPWTLSV